MHLAIFLSDLPVGGAERALLTLMRDLVGRLDRLDLVLVRKRGPFVSEIPAGVRVFELGKGSRAALLTWLVRLRLSGPVGVGLLPLLLGKLPGVGRALPRLVRYLRAERPDVLLTSMAENNIIATWAGALADADVRVMIREANTFSVEVEAGQRAMDEVISPLARVWYPRAQAIVAVSDGVAKDLAHTLAISPELIRVIYNGVDTDQLAASARQALDDPWVTDGGPPLVLAVGRLEDQKDFATLLRAFAIVRRRRPLRLMILGEGRARPSLEQVIRELDIATDVRLPGQASNVSAWMGRAALLVLSSRFEGFPNVLVEALACGCPVVATDCPSGPREILEGGRFGRLAPVGDSRALATAIEETLADPLPADLLRERARSFGAAHAADAYFALMTTVASQGGARREQVRVAA